MPKLVFSNTEEKDNTLNDDKAFTVARYRIDKVSENIAVYANSFLASGGTLYMKSARTLQKITFIFLR